jgi:nickel-dependent lactate racemase
MRILAICYPRLVMCGMRIELAYGKTRLPIELPDENTTVIEPQYAAGIRRAQEFDVMQNALRAPIACASLRERVNEHDRVAIAICDITRAIPTARILPPLLRELEQAGVRDENIVLLNATGTHRVNTDEELKRMVGADVFARYRVENHECHDDNAHTFVGTTRGGRSVRVDTRLLNASVRILTGFIEPHFFAGFSGGPKMVVPGLASLDTVMQMHDARLIGEPNARWGVTRGNPLWQELRDAAGLALHTPTPQGEHAFVFNFNVTLNRDLDITGIFCGDLDASHDAGCAFAREVAMQRVAEPFDIVVTTNSGYPLDLNLYQTVKGMSAAAQVVKENGDIVVASECIEGVPAHGKYGALLRKGSTPEEWLAMIHAPHFSEHDQWQVQIQAQIQKKAHVHLLAKGLSEDEIRAAQIHPIRDVERTVCELLRENANATICVLPEGPQTIPYVEKKVER